jgi:hypothetical protein
MAAALPLNPVAKQIQHTPVVTATVIEHPPSEKEVLYIGEEPRTPEMQFGPVRQHLPASVANIPPVRSKVSYVKQTATPAASAASRPPRPATASDTSPWRRFGEWLEGSWLATSLKVILVISSLLLVLSGEVWLVPIGLAGAAILLLTIVATSLTLGNESSTAQTNTSGITFRSWQEMTRDRLRGKSSPERITELLGSWLAAAFICALIGVVMLVVTDQFAPNLQSVSIYTWLTLSATLGSWCILAVGKFCEGSESDAVRRRLVMLTLGLLCGAAMFGCAELLLLDLHVGSDFNHTAQTMYTQEGAPKLPLFLSFYAVVLTLPRWWKQTDPLRRTRVNLLSVAICVFIGWLFHLVWPYPQPYGLMSLAMISLATQLSATWMTATDREQARREFRRV